MSVPEYLGSNIVVKTKAALWDLIFEEGKNFLWLSLFFFSVGQGQNFLNITLTSF